MADLWSSGDPAAWNAALGRYNDVVAKQRVARLPELDDWFRNRLPSLIASRAPAHITHDELIGLTEWKMARGVWRAPNLILVRGNPPAKVVEVSTLALSLVPHPTRPVETMATLAGVGPATASAAAAAYAPATYPFFDELVATQVPSLGKVAWTLGYYATYARRLRERTAELGVDWTPVMVEQALWAHVGGKAGSR